MLKGYDDDGRSVSKVAPDKSGWAKATKFEEQATALDRQVTKARLLIGNARARLAELTEETVP